MKTDHSMGCPRQGRDCEECTDATRSILASQDFWIVGACCLAGWFVLALVVLS